MAYEKSLGWLYENTWVIGIIYIIFGPMIAFFGGKWFPYIVASLVGLFTCSFLCSIALSAGWMATKGGASGAIITAIVLGVIAGVIVRKHFRIMLGLLGLAGGFFSGAFLFAMISGVTGGAWDAEWGYWFLSFISAIAGLVLAFLYGLPLVQISTAFVGSYLFMRSWTLFFPGNYPSEAELVKSGDEPLEISGIFWVFVGIFIVTFALSLTYQCKKGEEHVHKEAIDGFSRIQDGSKMSNKSSSKQDEEEEAEPQEVNDSY